MHDDTVSSLSHFFFFCIPFPLLTHLDSNMGILGASSVRRRQCNSWLWLTTIALTIGMVALLLRNADDQTLSRGRAALGLDDWFDGEKGIPHAVETGMS